MNLTRRAGLLLAALAACSPVTHWEKPGASESTMVDDMQRCRVAARMAQPHQGLPSPSYGIEDRDTREDQQFQNCMRDKGYSAKR